MTSFCSVQITLVLEMSQPQNASSALGSPHSDSQRNLNSGSWTQVATRSLWGPIVSESNLPVIPLKTGPSVKGTGSHLWIRGWGRNCKRLETLESFSSPLLSLPSLSPFVFTLFSPPGTFYCTRDWKYTRSWLNKSLLKPPSGILG